MWNAESTNHVDVAGRVIGLCVRQKAGVGPTLTRMTRRGTGHYRSKEGSMFQSGIGSESWNRMAPHVR